MGKLTALVMIGMGVLAASSARSEQKAAQFYVVPKLSHCTDVFEPEAWKTADYDVVPTSSGERDLTTGNPGLPDSIIIEEPLGITVVPSEDARIDESVSIPGRRKIEQNCYKDKGDGRCLLLILIVQSIHFTQIKGDLSGERWELRGSPPELLLWKLIYHHTDSSWNAHQDFFWNDIQLRSLKGVEGNRLTRSVRNLLTRSPEFQAALESRWNSIVAQHPETQLIRSDVSSFITAAARTCQVPESP